MTYRKVIHDIVQVKPKYEESSCGDCMVSKEDFQALEKLAHSSSYGMEPMDQVNGRGRSISRG